MRATKLSSDSSLCLRCFLLPRAAISSSVGAVGMVVVAAGDGCRREGEARRGRGGEEGGCAFARLLLLSLA